jgi:predicted transcriptional regulator
MTLREKAKRAYKRLGTQRAVAELLGISQGYVSKLLADGSGPRRTRVSLDERTAIANAFRTCGNISQVARDAGRSRNTVTSIIRAHGLHVERTVVQT